MPATAQNQVARWRRRWAGIPACQLVAAPGLELSVTFAVMTRVAEVVKAGYPDHTARDPDSHYYDEKATDENPRWFMVDIKFVRKLPWMFTLRGMKDEDALDDMVVTGRSRLSVQPVEQEHFEHVLDRAEQEPEE